jgi:hypothetical protein
LVCVALLMAHLRRGRPAAEGPPPIPLIDRPPRTRFRRAAAAAVLAGAVLGFTFGIGVGAASIPAVALVLWRGIGPLALTLAAGALLGIVVPALYLLRPVDASKGNHADYAVEHLPAHWFGVAALVLLMIALWRTLSSARSGAPPPPEVTHTDARRQRQSPQLTA